MLVTTAACDAQTWHWTYVTSTPNSPFLAAQSSVSISANTIRMAYTIPLQKRQVVIESCNADLRDVQDATMLRSAGTTYLLIRFKPQHTAACVAGKQASVALPTADHRYVSTVAAAINASCCASATGAARPSPRAVIARITPPTPIPAPKPKPAPIATGASRPAATPAAEVAATSPAASATTTPSPKPSPSPSPVAVNVQDWVENDGLFWFVRMRNTGPARVTPVGEVFNCRNVNVGCGSFAAVVLEPGGTATVATVATVNPAAPATFQYRFSAGDGTRVIAGGGSSTRATPRTVARMNAAELRTAQAGALGQYRSPSGPPTQSTPARLVKRGSSRLAIGQTGTALVRLTIGPNGTPEEATIVSTTNQALTAAAIETAVSSTYAPATQNGRPVAGKYVATFSFDGEDPTLASVPVWKRSPTPAPSVSPGLSVPGPSATPPAPAVSPSPSAAAAAPAASAAAEPQFPATPEPQASPGPAATPAQGETETPSPAPQPSAAAPGVAPLASPTPAAPVSTSPPR
jgi:hypothetical protein